MFPVPQPIVLGHEGAGIVEQVGAGVSGFAVGDKVVMSYRACGACPSCAAHAPSYCHGFFPLNFSGARADGSTALSCDSGPVHSHFFGQSSFASHVVAHQSNVVKVAADADLAVLAPFGCGIQTGAGAVINALKVGVGGEPRRVRHRLGRALGGDGGEAGGGHLHHRRGPQPGPARSRQGSRRHPCGECRHGQSCRGDPANHRRRRGLRDRHDGADPGALPGVGGAGAARHAGHHRRLAPG
ncbi:putative aryl-alcohol dehydrogenase [Acidocella sp. MX-AZ02]|nr:putative aryl-alcohol dehydrogenase [Acidocella sp. MX-AZ02]